MNKQNPSSAKTDFSRPAPLPARQARSREAMRKIVAAFQQLLADKRYDVISMNEVAREAGVSVGTIYTRFPSKDHLLLYLVEETFFTRATKLLDDIEAMAAEDGARLVPVLTAFFTQIADLYASTRYVFAPLSLVLRLTGDESLKEPALRYNKEIHKRLTSILLTLSDEIAHADRETALHFVIQWGLSALREMILYDVPLSGLDADAHTIQVSELCAALTLYLTHRDAI